MANTYHQIYLQTVFAVKYRAAVLDKAKRTWGDLTMDTKEGLGTEFIVLFKNT